MARAIEAAGGQSALARKIGRRQSTIWYWLNKSGKVPAASAMIIHEKTGVPLSELRPDLWPGRD